jgi:pimeloyl-ACP methyl ester carboxylesterase
MYRLSLSLSYDATIEPTLFRDVIGGLAEACFVIAPRLPGFGGSPPVDRHCQLSGLEQGT